MSKIFSQKKQCRKFSLGNKKLVCRNFLSKIVMFAIIPFYAKSPDYYYLSAKSKEFKSFNLRLFFQRHFIVMQSIFWPSSGISERFDIKGRLGGRYQDPKTLQEQFVLKDQNFNNTPLNLGRHKQWYAPMGDMHNVIYG